MIKLPPVKVKRINQELQIFPLLKPLDYYIGKLQVASRDIISTVLNSSKAPAPSDEFGNAADTAGAFINLGAQRRLNGYSMTLNISLAMVQAFKLVHDTLIVLN